MTDKDCRGSVNTLFYFKVWLLLCSGAKYLKLLFKYSSSKHLFSYVHKIVSIFPIFSNIVHTSRGRTESLGN